MRGEMKENKDYLREEMREMWKEINKLEGQKMKENANDEAHE